MTATEGDSEGRLELAVLTDGCQACQKVCDFLTIEDTPFTLEFETTLGKTYVVAVSGERFSDVGVFDVLLEVSLAIFDYWMASKQNLTFVNAHHLFLFLFCDQEREPVPGSNPEKLSDISASGENTQEPPPDAADVFSSSFSGAHPSNTAAGFLVLVATMGMLLVNTIY